MCGILGMVENKASNRAEMLLKMRDSMFHRGPDDGGVWWSSDGSVGLAHRRLAIVDLSPAGHQPMLNKSAELCVVFNGEIYNHKELRQELKSMGYSFRSKSDTEVILAAYTQWGRDCLSRLNGMFAFALYDENKRQLFMARDRAGEKPLFYSFTNGEFRFSSELKALMADASFSRKIDAEALDCYLAMGYVPGERCILDNVRKLPPAHALVFDMNHRQVKTWRYWELPELSLEASSGHVNEEELLDELEALLEDSVGKQMEADVSIGVLLSGGVDSSLVTAMAVRSSDRVKTFSVGFEGFGKYDESAHARLIANHFGTEHLELQAGEVKPELMPHLARQFDEPMIDSSMIPTFLLSQLVREHCTVALGGDGGDELFGGYPSYDRLLWTKKMFGCIPRGIRSAISKTIGDYLPLGFRGKNWLQCIDVDFRMGLPMVAGHFDVKARKSLLHLSHNVWVAENIREQRVPQNENLLQRATRMDFENYLPEDILVKIDRASMLNSLELRAPFLDHRVIEFAFSKVPPHLKATTQHRKILLKKLCARVLPLEFDQQRKQGFSIPLAHWLEGGEWQKFFQEVLMDSNDSFFNRKYVSFLFDGQAKGRNNGERLFGLVLFELWRREYAISF